MENNAPRQRHKKNQKIDERKPTYIGKWKKSVPYKDTGLAWDNDYDEPHAKRKKAILKKYPQITKLYGPCSKTKYIIFIHLILHFIGLQLCTIIPNKFLFVLFCYIYGGTLTSLSGVLLHDCTHSLASHSSFVNVILGYLSNIPIALPIFGSFQKYHLDHHLYLGVHDKDADLPMNIEIKMIQGNAYAKLVYISFYPIFYIARSFTIPKTIVLREILNILIHFSIMYCTYKLFGICSIYYLILSTWFAYSIHPAAAHLIQEHFTFADGQETYSYYGPFNLIYLNIGYHNEHHDFPTVAWDKLPEIRKIAPEFYDFCYIQTSWFGVIYEFVTRPMYGPQSRVARTMETMEKGRKIKTVESLDNSTLN